MVMKNLTRPDLNPVPLGDVLPPLRETVYVTMNPGQWDQLLNAAYAQGAVLLELDDRERPARAYRKPT